MKTIIKNIFGYCPNERELKESAIGAICCIGMLALACITLTILG